VEVQVAGIDAETVGKLPVRERDSFVPEELQHAEAERVAERLQLLRSLDRDDIEDVGERLSHIASI
jgi:hypothetical protein